MEKTTHQLSKDLGFWSCFISLTSLVRSPTLVNFSFFVYKIAGIILAIYVKYNPSFSGLTAQVGTVKNKLILKFTWNQEMSLYKAYKGSAIFVLQAPMRRMSDSHIHNWGTMCPTVDSYHPSTYAMGSLMLKTLSHKGLSQLFAP